MVEGPAARAIQGLTLSEANYEAAKEILKQRYGRPQQVIAAHMDELLKIPSCMGEKSSQLRYVYDKVSIHVRGLESLGVTAEQYGSMLIPVVMSKLPTEIRVQIARLTSSEVWSIREMLELIRKEVEAREASEHVKLNNEKKTAQSYPSNTNRNLSSKPSTASALFLRSSNRPTEIRCVYCKNSHYSSACDKVTDVNERKNILRRDRRCFLCLQTNHRIKECRNNRSCRKCSGRHHLSLCVRPSQENNEMSAPIVKNNTSNPEQPIEEMEQTTPTSVVHSQTKQKVLLQTARTVAYGNDKTRTVPVRVLFDSCSQRTFIKNELKNKLNLKVIRTETVCLNTFGSEKYVKQKCDVVKVQLKAKYGEDVELTAICYDKICSPLPVKVNVQEYLHLDGLEFADNLESENDQESFQILIGSDRYWDLTTNEIIKGPEGESGPIAMQSKFGWLIAGPVHSSDQNDNVYFNATNLLIDGIHDESEMSLNYKRVERDELVDTLKKFWEIEELGIRKFPEKERQPDAAQSPEFLCEIEFKEGRYEIGLPWKQIDDKPLPNDFQLSLDRLNSLYSRLEKDPDILAEYTRIIDEQIKLGMVEYVPEEEQTREFIEQNNVHFLPHFAVIRKDRENRI